MAMHRWLASILGSDETDTSATYAGEKTMFRMLVNNPPMRRICEVAEIDRET